MPIFITQGRYTQQAIKGLIDKPEDRREAVEALMGAAGYRVIDYYVTLGDYDFLIIVEGPSELPASLLVAAASGTASDLRTTAAFSTADLKAAAEKAAAIRGDYRPMGG